MTEIYCGGMEIDLASKSLQDVTDGSSVTVGKSARIVVSKRGISGSDVYSVFMAPFLPLSFSILQFFVADKVN